MNADYGIILCGCIKPFPSDPRVPTKIKIFRGDSYKTWDKNRANDCPIAMDIYEELLHYDIWVGHNAVNFDIPFLRTRLIKQGAILRQPKVVDPVKLARRFLRLGGNSLERVAAHLGFHGKTKLSPDHWNKAALNGDRNSLNYIVEHCIADVILLENVFNELRPFVPRINEWGSDR